MNKICIQAYISGHVHGVWFRASTQEVAIRLGLTGWVRNLPEGRVEVMACGEAAQIKLLEAWLAHGPRLAKVENVAITEKPWEAFESFEVLR